MRDTHVLKEMKLYD